MENLRRISKKYYLRQIVACMLVYFMFFNPALVFATSNPVQVAGDLIGGYNVGPDITEVLMGGSSRAVINWDSLDTLSHQELHFLKTSGNFAVLNRVIAGGQTEFNGSLFGNQGDIFIVNTRGIVFGPDSYVKARTFLASAIDISNRDFMVPDGLFKFERNSSPYPYSGMIGNVTNEGTGTGHGIYAKEVALIGRNVINKGTIVAEGRDNIVVMAAGDSVYLSRDGSNVVVEVGLTDPAAHVVDNGGLNGTGPGTIDAEDGKIILAAGDIFSTAIAGVESLRAEAKRDITLEGAITANGDITLVADADNSGGFDGGRMLAKSTLTTTTGDIDISATDTIRAYSAIALEDDVEAGRDLLLNSNTMTADNVLLKAGQDVIVRDDRFLFGQGSLTVEADRHITLGGPVIVGGTATLKADADTVNREPDAVPGGTMWAKSTLTSIVGDIDIYASDNTIDLDDDVYAAQDILLNNDTVAADGITLKAGRDVEISASKTLTAEGSLTIEATGGEIKADTSIIDMAANGETLTLTQNASMDMEQDFSVNNRRNTDLVADSTGGSVTSEAAGEWSSIAAHAAENITLSDISEVITTRALTTDNGDITINSQQGKVMAYGAISARQDVKITATDETSDAILLYDNVDAAQDILLNNNTWAADGVNLKAGQDVRVGYDEIHNVYNPKTLTGDGELTIEANRHITLGGDVEAGGTLTLKADADNSGGPDGGTMHARGKLTTTAGDIDIYASDETIDLDDNVTAAQDILLHNNTVVAAGKKLDAGRDVVVSDGKALDGEGGLEVLAGRNVSLGGATTTVGTLTVRADDNVTIGGTAGAATQSGSHMMLKADADDDEIGDVLAKGAVTSLGKDPGSGISMWVQAENITFEQAAEAYGHMFLMADFTEGSLDGQFRADGTLTTYDGGNIEIMASDNTISLGDNVTASVADGGNILLHNNVWVADGVTLQAGQDVISDGGKTITGDGQLDILAKRHIKLGGAVTTNGSLNLNANTDDAAGGDVRAQSSLESLGADIYASGENVFVEGPVTAAGTVKVDADDTIRLVGPVLANGADGSGIGIKLMADHSDADNIGNIIANSSLTTTAGNIEGWGQNITVDGTINSAGSLTLSAYKNITLNSSATSTKVMWLKADFDGDHIGNLWAKSSLYTASQGLGARGENITVDGTSYSGAWINMIAGDNITLGDDATSSGNMILVGDADTDTTGTVWAKGELTSLGGRVSITASDNTIDLDGDVYAFTNIELNNNTVVADGITLEAGDDVIVADGKSLDGEGALTVEAGDNITLGGTVSADGDMYLYADLDNNGGLMWAKSSVTTTGADNKLYAEGENIQIDGPVGIAGDIEMYADDSITFGDTVEADGDIWLYADGDNDADKAGLMWAKSSVTTYDSDLYVEGENIQIDGAVEIAGDIEMHADDSITLGSTARANGDIYLSAEEDGDDVGNVDVHGLKAGGSIDIYASDDTINIHKSTDAGAAADVDAGDDIRLFNNTVADADVKLLAGGNMFLAAGKTLDGLGDLTVEAGSDIIIGGDDPFDGWAGGSGGDVTVAGNLTITADPTSGGANIWTWGKVTTTDGGNIEITAGDDIYMLEDVDSAGNLTVAAGRADFSYGNLEAYGNLTAIGDIELSAWDDSIWLYNDYVQAGSSILLNSATYAAGDIIAGGDVTANSTLTLIGGWDYGHPDQVVQAQNGTLTANSWVRKVTPGDLWLLGGSDDLAVDLRYVSDGPFDPAASTCLGNLWIEGQGDVQISGNLTTFGECYRGVENGYGNDIPMFDFCRPTGGVAVISQEGKIYTEGGDNDTLNVSITGSSNHWAYDELHDRMGLGVDLPYGDGKAAIIIASKEDLKIGNNAKLRAYGKYYDDVDDREAIDFLDTPATIGGVLRKEGDPFDAAIYLASTGDGAGEGNVDVSSPVSIMSCEFEPGPEQYGYEFELEPKGAMVIDAYKTVTFGGPGSPFENSLAAGDVGDRLEVVSRITEWLSQAVGRLPYVFGGGPFLPDYPYVLRGAGLPGITDGRAWVLEDPLSPAPLQREAGEASEKEEFAEGGCPALMNWLADELGIEEEIQVFVANTFAYSTDIQPCEMCARLKDASIILEDAEDTHIAALAQVVNEFIAPDAPIAPEQMASIASALASPEAGTHYAAAGQWLDALAEYVGILNTEMGFAAVESVAFAGKYVTPITEGDNASLATYVEARLAAFGG